MGKFKFNVGDLLGPNKIKLLERTTKNSRNEWYGKFICPYCGKEFQAIISKIASGHTKSCGCLVKHDITNQRFGRLVALYPNGQLQNGTTVWHCRCDCGNEKDIRVTSLLSGVTQSCGCLRTDLKALDLTSQKFGHLTAIKRLDNKDNWGNFYWQCVCDCGREVEVLATSLVSGNTQTCGMCINRSLQEEKIANILQSLNIEFIQEKTFEDCINPETQRKLRFDFYLPKQNILIEYDGEQHFYYNEMFTKENFIKTQKRDKIKNQYCLNNNIRLIRIPYTEKNYISKEYLINLITNGGRDMELSHDRYGMESEDKR